MAELPIHLVNVDTAEQISKVWREKAARGKAHFMPVTSKALGIAATLNSLPFRWKWEFRRFCSMPLPTFRTILYGFMIAYSGLDFAFTGARLVQVVMAGWPIIKSDKSLGEATSLFAVLGTKLACLFASYVWVANREAVITFVNQVLVLRYRGKV